MKNIITIIALLFFNSNFFSQDSLKIKKILIVATNINLVGKNESGTFLPEIANPFKYFINKGYDVDIVTPKGGRVAIYAWGDATERNELFIYKTKNSLSPIEVKNSQYVAIFYPGGHGQYFDVVKDDRISILAAKIYENGGVIGTTGHGAASLINIKLRNNKYLVEGKKMTCFPRWSELKDMYISDYGKLLPFDMQEILTKRGANLIVCPSKEKLNKECTQIVDYENRMVTGAFAGDADWVAEEIIKQLQTNKK